MENEETKKAWENYIKKQIPLPDHIKGVRDQILRSWKRCQKTLPPTITTTKSMNQEELDLLRKQNTLLIDIVYPYLLDFYHDLNENNFIIMLTDASGCMLERIGSHHEVNDMIQTRQFFNGNYFSEQDVGTGGVGLCLVEQKPVIVYGFEHYNSEYHDLVCYAAPIQDSNRQTLGSISITGPIKHSHPLILNLLNMAIKGIEKELTLTKINTIMDTTIKSITQGVLVIDENKNILYHNEKALQLLKLESTSLVHQNLYDYLDQDTLDPFLQDFRIPINQHDCVLFNKQKHPLYLSLQVKPQIKDQHLTSTLILIESLFDLHRQTSLNAGFKATYTLHSLIGISTYNEQLKKNIQAIANLSSPVFLLGEKGTEIEMVVQALHNESNRKDNPFVRFDCRHFTYENINHLLLGTSKSLGQFELSNEGTLFFYEISQLSLEGQEILVNFLENQTLTKENQNYPYHLNVRILAYSSTPLDHLVEKNQFNKKLYYLLRSLSITLAPLRQRQEDLSLLAKSIARKFNPNTTQKDVLFDHEAIEALVHYNWPGNLKQLETVIENALLASDNSTIKLSHLPIDLVNHYYSTNKNSSSIKEFTFISNENLAPKMQDYNEILYALKESKGDVKEASKLLFIPVSTLYRKIKKFNLHPRDYK